MDLPPIVVGTLGLHPMYVDYRYNLFDFFLTFAQVRRVRNESGGRVATIVEVAKMRRPPRFSLGRGFLKPHPTPSSTFPLPSPSFSSPCLCLSALSRSQKLGRCIPSPPLLLLPFPSPLPLLPSSFLRFPTLHPPPFILTSP